MKLLFVSIAAAVLVVASAHTAAATQTDPQSGVPVRDLETLTKGVCVNYSINGTAVQVAVPYPSWVAYHQIGDSGSYWLYRSGNDRIRVQSLAFTPLYQVPGEESGPSSCTPVA